MRSTIKTNKPKRRRNENDLELRQKSVFYFMPNCSATYVSVCKTFYLHTLGMKSNGMVTAFLKSQENNPLSSPVDNRGTKKNAQSLQEQNQAIIDHINSFNPQLSHYNLAHTPHKRFLDPDLSIRSLWNDFNALEDQTKISYSKYQKVFRSLNIGFGRPSQDECDLCEFYKTHSHTDGEEQDKCEQCKMLKLHLENARLARKEYQNDKKIAASSSHGNTTSQHATLAADMQKVIMLPKTTLKSQYFVSRLTVFNETFSELNGENDMCLLWREGEAGRCAAEVASAYWKVISVMSESKSFTFWCDNCCAQNKNWTLFCALWLCTNKVDGPDYIELKYLEKGHTFMRPDSVHGSIGRKMKKTPNVYDWEQLIETIQTSAKSINVINLTYLDMFVVKDCHARNAKTPKLKELKVIRFQKGSNQLFFKKAFIEKEFQQCEFLNSKLVKDTADDFLPESRLKPRGINQEKKKEICKVLVPFMPAGQAKFWLDMPTTASNPDLSKERDAAEYEFPA